MSDTDRISRSIGPSSSLIEVRGTSATESFATFRPEKSESGPIESTAGLYDRVAEFIAASGAEVVQERCYASTGVHEEIAACRQHAYEKHSVQTDGAFCFVGEEPCEGGAVAGVQLWLARSGDGPLVHPLVVDDRVVGREFRRQDVSFVSLPCVRPTEDPAGDAGLQPQAVSMFREAGRLLDSAGLGFRDVVRTWIYLPELLRWYHELNAARHHVFREAGLLDADRRPQWLPASTGIQGACPLGRVCMMGVLAVARRNGAPLDVNMVTSPGQDEAVLYGSAFSRAVELKDEAISRVFVSGTASIDKAGNTVHVDDFPRQTRHTLQVIRDLLTARGHDFSDVAHFVAFLKRPEYLGEFRRIAGEEGVHGDVVVETVADVCRDDLLIELEVMTIKPVA